MEQTCLEGTVFKRLLYYFDESKYVLLALYQYKVQYVLCFLRFSQAMKKKHLNAKRLLISQKSDIIFMGVSVYGNA